MATKILIVDDNPDDIDLCRRALANAPEDYQVECVASSEACTQKLRSATPDCVLLDYSLPDEDGFILLTRI